MEYTFLVFFVFVVSFGLTILLQWVNDRAKYGGLPFMPPVGLNILRVPVSALPETERVRQLHRAWRLIDHLSHHGTDVWVESRDEIDIWLYEYRKPKVDREYLLKRAYLILLGVEYGHAKEFRPMLPSVLVDEVDDWLTEYLGSKERVGETPLGRAFGLYRVFIASMVGLIAMGLVIIVLSSFSGS
jgi:hypothetical protein